MALMHWYGSRRVRCAAAGLLAFANVAIAGPRGTASASPSAAVADLDAFIARTLTEYRVPGAAVVAIVDGQVVLVKGYGVRDVTKPGNVDENTIFQLASVSKTFTAAAAATVVDQGTITWDEPIIDYLPQFVDYDPYATRYMSMRDLLAMRTGWPQFTGDKLDDFGYTRAQILQRLRYLKPAYSLREVSQYSNAGYFVAGEAAARAAGTSWNDLVKDRLLVPLGMTRSGTSVHDLADSNAAAAHAIVAGVVRTVAPSNQDTMGAAGAVTSTASDLGRWLQLFLNGGTYGGRTILKRDTVAEMEKRSMVGLIEFTELPPISDTTGFYYGLGFDSYDYAGHHVIEKAGALAGVRTDITMLPDRRAGIAVLSNLNIAPFPEAVRTYFMEKTVLGTSPDGDLREIAARAKRIAAFLDPPARPAHPGPFAGTLASVIGTYDNPLYGRCTISRANAGLELACGPARDRAALEHWDNGEFLAHWPGATSSPSAMTFTIGKDGTATSYTDDTFGLFTRVGR